MTAEHLRLTEVRDRGVPVFDKLFETRLREGDEFREAIQPSDLSADERLIQRQASRGCFGASNSITTTSGDGCVGIRPDRMIAASGRSSAISTSFRTIRTGVIT